MPAENLFTRLSPELIRHIASCMHPNYVATDFKLTCKDVAQAVRAQFSTIQLRREPRALPSFRFRSILIALAEQPWPGAAFVAHWGHPEPWRALNRRDRHRLLCLAASSHHAPSLDAALAHCGTVITADGLAAAISAGDLAACRRLHETEGCDTESELAAAAAGVAGSLPVCNWIVETAPPEVEVGRKFALLSELCYAAHSDALEWALALRQAGVSRHPHELLGAAAAGGRVELLQQLATRFPLNRHAEIVLTRVAFGCPLAVLQQYYEPWGNRSLRAARQKRQLLVAAAASPTPDWAAKCEWLWARWGEPAAGLGTDFAGDERCGQQMADIMSRPDFPQRLQLLASYGLGRLIEGAAPWEAGVVGSTAAVEFCLDQLPALLRQQAVPGAGGGPAAAAGVPLPVAENAAAQEQQVAPLERIAAAAFKHGHVPVLRLLRERGYIFPAPHLVGAVSYQFAKNAPVRSRKEDLARTNTLRSLRYLLLEDPGAVQQGGADKDWSSLFRNAARSGADVPLLQHLYEQRGGAIDLVAVAEGGSEEALEWAVAALTAAAGQAPEPLSCSALQQVLRCGNWAAADWLVRHGLVAASRQELVEGLVLGGARRGRPYPPVTAELQWAVGMGGGRGQQEQVQWTPELHAALERLLATCRRCAQLDGPARVDWLAGLVAAAEEVVGGARAVGAGGVVEGV